MVDLNIVGEFPRSKITRSGAMDADYAELSPSDEIQMFYKFDYIDKSNPDSKKVWYYLSYADLWMGSRDDMQKKRLLKIV